MTVSSGLDRPVEHPGASTRSQRRAAMKVMVSVAVGLIGPQASSARRPAAQGRPYTRPFEVDRRRCCRSFT